MNSIEMTDVDGDGLSLITRGQRTWVTCTSGEDEVTVGPFPTRLVRGVLAPVADGADPAQTVALLRGLPSAEAPSAEMASAATSSAPSPSAQSPSATDPSVGPTGPAAPELNAQDRERAWAAFQSLSETAPLRAALDGALDAALARPAARPEAEELVEDLRHATIELTDTGALADLLLSLGYRKA